MERISPYYATPLAGGELCSGMVIVLTAQMMWRHGLKLGITHDKRRQILLNLICLICAINTSISYGYNATKNSVLISNITTIITFLCVQYSLMILNHNTIIRATNLYMKGTGYRQQFDQFCYFLYIIPLVVLIPIYFAFMDTHHTDKPLNTSFWNKNVYKPLNIALIILTEGMATATDLLLFRKVNASFIKLQAISESGSFAFSNKRIKKTSLARQNLFLNYSITWLLILIDITVKALIAVGVPLLFDSIITILTVAMRSRANLQFGMEMQNVIERQSSSFISSLDESVNQPTSELSHVNNISSKPILEV